MLLCGLWACAHESEESDLTDSAHSMPVSLLGKKQILECLRDTGQAFPSWKSAPRDHAPARK